jgi:hypothetical protein
MNVDITLSIVCPFLAGLSKTVRDRKGLPVINGWLDIGISCPAGAFDAGLEADSYYTANPTKSEIRQFCEGQKEENLGRLKDLNRSLNVSFYDDEAHTPNYTQGYDPSDESFDQYRVADYVINRVGGGTDEVTFYKEIPE